MRVAMHLLRRKRMMQLRKEISLQKVMRQLKVMERKKELMLLPKEKLPLHLLQNIISRKRLKQRSISHTNKRRNINKLRKPKLSNI